MRLAVLTSHPIQYYPPLFRALAERLELEVLFAHRQSPKQQAAAGFGTAFDWDVDLLEGYPSRFLANRARRPGVDHFRGCDTPEVGAIIERGRFDAVLVTGWHLLCYWQAIRACHRLGTPVLVRGDSHLGSPRNLAMRLVKAGLHRWLIRQFDGFLYVGSRNRAYLLHYGARAERLFFTPHFVDTAWFRERAAAAAPARAAFRAQLGVGADERVILFAGRLVPFKRPADVIRATALLAAGAAPDVRLVVAGAGPLQVELERLAAATRAPVTFAGFRNQSELPACYDLADVLVLSSTSSETWGLVVNEAMAAGTPVVVSQAVGCAPDLVDGRTGRTTTPGDVPALADAILATLGSKHEPAVQAALAAKMSTYSVETAVAGVYRALEHITSG